MTLPAPTAVPPIVLPVLLTLMPREELPSLAVPADRVAAAQDIDSVDVAHGNRATGVRADVIAVNSVAALGRHINADANEAVNVQAADDRIAGDDPQAIGRAAGAGAVQLDERS